MAAFTSKATGNWSATGSTTWTTAGTPGAGDTVTIAVGHVVTVDVDTAAMGANGSNVGHAVTINGASSSSFGTLQVAAGVTLTLRGADTTSNTLMLINRYGLFAPQAGSTVVGDVAGDYGSIILNKGRLEAYGSAGNLITFKQPDANLVWSTQVTAEANNANWEAQLGKVACYLLAHDWVSNSAGTGAGSSGDNSVSFGGTHASSLTNPVASISAIASTGDYYFDYDMGAVWFYWTASTAPAFTVTYKYGTFGATAKGWGISSTQATDYNTAIFDYCTFLAMGKAANANTRVLDVGSKKSATAAANRLFQLTHCTVANCYQFLGLSLSDGATGDLLKVENNAIGSCRGDSGGVFGSTITCYNAACSYISVSNNTVKSRNDFIDSTNASGSQKPQSSWSISNNTVYWSGMCIASLPLTSPFPDTVIAGNTFWGLGANSSRCLQDVGGTSGHNLLIHDNTFNYSYRTIHYTGYLDFYNNVVAFSLHHGFPASTLDGIQISRVHLYNNLFWGNYLGATPIGYGSPSVEIGYNHKQWIDDFQCVNNTFAGNNQGGFGFGDCQDTNAYTYMSKVVCTNNLLVMGTNLGGAKAWQRPTNGSNLLARCHVSQWDYNLDYNFTTRYTGLTRQGTFAVSGANYNTIAGGSRNCPGVALFDPSFSSKSGGSVTFTVTNSTTQTVAWGAGTAVNVVVDSGTFSAAATASTINSGASTIGNTLTDSTKSGTWVTLTGNGTAAGSRGIRWIKVTSGTASGQFAVIVSQTTTTLTTCPAFSALPQSGDSYVILEGEVTCTDGAESVKVGLDWRDLPTANGTYTDSSIGFADHSVTGSDPLLTSSTGTTAVSYRFSGGSPAKDAGTADNAAATDYLGTARPQGSAVDIGFFELVAAGGPLMYLRRMNGGFTTMG